MNEQLSTTPETTPEGIRETERTEGQRRKTLAIRLEEQTHAKLAFIAQLSGSSIADEIRRSIELRITAAQDDPDLIARAEHVQQQIEREAQARAAAIAGFLGTTAVTTTTENPGAVSSTPTDAPAEPAKKTASRGRRGAGEATQ